MKTVLPETSPVAEACAAQWVVRRRDGLSATEERELAAWLAADPAHALAFSRLATMADALHRVRSTGAGGAIMTELKIRERKRRTRRRALAAMGSVAAFVVVALQWPTKPRAAVGSDAPVAARSLEPIRRLPDGSIVELNTGADLVVEYEPGMRRVTLRRGEALFRVAHDASRPFVVRAGSVALRAVGTAFSVRLDGNSVDVLVTEGKVAVADVVAGRTLLPTPSDDETVPVLTAGQRVSIGGAEGLAPWAENVAEVAAPEIATRLAWRISRLEFSGVALAQAVAQINRVNAVTIVLADEAMGRLRISGTFAPDDPSTFARLAAASLGLEAQNRGDGQILLRATEPATKRD